MARRLIYKMETSMGVSLSDSEWREVERLQHWYNSEFRWSSGKLSFRRYVMFPNLDESPDPAKSVWTFIAERDAALRAEGLSEYEIVEQLERERIVFVKWGGYYDGCLASGFTRVADNEWNAFLVCDFLLKASTVCNNAVIHVWDEGQFIKTGQVWMAKGEIVFHKGRLPMSSFLYEMIEDRHIFSIVNPAKYDNHLPLKNVIPEFNRMETADRLSIVRNWNWLGYGDGYDSSGDDVTGFDLNLKVKRFVLLD